jgi:hypothetical protein
MEDMLYGVALDGLKEYVGRDDHDRIQSSFPGAGRLMTKDCAEQLAARLKATGKFKSVRVVTNFRGERDEIAATSLADLGEDHIGVLERNIRLALSNGVLKAEVLETCNRVTVEV